MWITQHTGPTALRPIRRTKQLWLSVLLKDTSTATWPGRDSNPHSDNTRTWVQTHQTAPPRHCTALWKRVAIHRWPLYRGGLFIEVAVFAGLNTHVSNTCPIQAVLYCLMQEWSKCMLLSVHCESCMTNVSFRCHNSFHIYIHISINMPFHDSQRIIWFLHDLLPLAQPIALYTCSPLSADGCRSYAQCLQTYGGKHGGALHTVSQCRLLSNKATMVPWCYSKKLSQMQKITS